MILRPSQFRLALNNLLQKRKSLNSKPNHIPHPISSQIRIQLLRVRPPLTIHSQRHIPWRPIRRVATRRPRRTTLTQRIRALQILPHMLRQPCHNIRGGTFVILDRLLRPAGVRYPRGERIERETAFVHFARAGCGEDAGADEAAGRGLGHGDGFVAVFEEGGDLVEDLADLGGREVVC